MTALSFRDLDESSWRDFERLFESRGGPKSCWCMVWRAAGTETRQTKGRERKSQMEQRVRQGMPIGILGYLDGEPVAWCSIAPRPTYRRLGGPVRPGEIEEHVWSLACFFVRRDLRSTGLLARLIAASIAHARAKGARVVEAYPVDPQSPSYRFMGYVPAFETAGFYEVGMAGTRRHIMRLDLNEA